MYMAVQERSISDCDCEGEGERVSMSKSSFFFNHPFLFLSDVLSSVSVRSITAVCHS